MTRLLVSACVTGFACIITCSTIGAIVISQGESNNSNSTTNCTNSTTNCTGDLAKYNSFVKGVITILVGTTVGIGIIACCLFQTILSSVVSVDSSVDDVEMPRDYGRTIDISKNECCICLVELGNNIALSKCNHAFHEDCLRQWLRNRRVCPLCITEL